MANPELAPGQLLLDEFQVEQLLGEGGWGAVYRVRNIVTGEHFALKRPLADHSASRLQLLKELKAWMNAPRHPCIAACRFYRIVDDAIYVFAEFADGGSLQDGLDRGSLYQGTSQAVLGRILEVAIWSAWGIHAAHRSGLIHQDSKPGNILITTSGLAKVSDFGLTEKVQPTSETEGLLDYLVQGLGRPSALERVRAALRRTLVPEVPKEVAGAGRFTAQYASPEQAAGLALTTATDVWSWGVTVLQLFCGRLAWDWGPDAPQALARLGVSGPFLAGPPVMPRRVASVLQRCLAQSPVQRWSSLDEAADELMLAYSETLGVEFPHQRPAAVEEHESVFTRALPTGSSWDDPRGWLDHAYWVGGMAPEAAREHYPDLSGSPSSRALSDLMALEHALQLLQAQFDKRNRDEGAGDIARLRGNLALVKVYLGDLPGAIEHLDCAMRLLELSEHPQDCIDRCNCFNSKAIALRRLGRLAEAKATCEQGLRWWRSLPEARDLGDRNLVTALLLNTRANAESDAQERLRIRSEAVRLSDQSPVDNAKYLAGQASDFGQVQDWEGYERTVLLARSTLSRLIDAERKLELRPALATLAFNQAKLNIDRGRWTEALRHLDDAVGVFDELARGEGQWELADLACEARFEKGKVQEALARPMDALEAYADARRLLSQSVIQGGRTDLAAMLVDTVRNEANLKTGMGAGEDAVSLIDTAVNLLRQLGPVKLGKACPPLLARALSVRSACLLSVGRVADALSSAQDAVRQYADLPSEQLAREFLDLANANLALGIAARRTGDSQATWEAYQRALGLLEGKQDREARSLQALVHYNVNNLLSDASYFAEAIPHIDQAIDIWSFEARREGASLRRDDLAMAHKAKTNLHLKIGDYDGALVASDRALEMLQHMIDSQARSDLIEEFAKLLGVRSVLFKMLGDLPAAAEAATASARAFESVAQTKKQNAAIIQHMDDQAHAVRRLVSIDPADIGQLCFEADRQAEHAQQMSQSGDSFHACQMLDEALVIYGALARQHPSRPWLMRIAQLSLQLGVTSMHARRDVSAERSFLASIAAFDRLIVEYRDLSALVQWGRAKAALAAFFTTVGREGDATRQMEQATVRMQSLSKDDFRAWQQWAKEMLAGVAP